VSKEVGRSLKLCCRKKQRPKRISGKVSSSAHLRIQAIMGKRASIPDNERGSIIDRKELVEGLTEM